MCRRSLLAGLSSLALYAACMPAFAGVHDTAYQNASLQTIISQIIRSLTRLCQQGRSW